MLKAAGRHHPSAPGERPGAADGNDYGHFAQIQRVIDAHHAETYSYSGGEKPPETLPVHFPYAAPVIMSSNFYVILSRGLHTS
jgi:hypothetical protein